VPPTGVSHHGITGSTEALRPGLSYFTSTTPTGQPSQNTTVTNGNHVTIQGGAQSRQLAKVHQSNEVSATPLAAANAPVALSPELPPPHQEAAIGTLTPTLCGVHRREQPRIICPLASPHTAKPTSSTHATLSAAETSHQVTAVAWSRRSELQLAGAWPLTVPHRANSLTALLSDPPNWSGHLLTATRLTIPRA